MDLFLNFQNQDTTQQQSAITIQREALLTHQPGGFQIDSARLTANKTLVPVIKTIPVVPLNDTIPQPVYDVLKDAFYISNESNLLSKLNLNPVEPLANSINNAQYKKVIRKQQTIAVPEKSISRKQTRQQTAEGFENTDWMLVIVVVSLMLFAWIRVGFGRFVNTVVQASYNFFTARRIFEEANVVRSRIFVFFNLLFYINIGLFSSQCIDFFNLNPDNIQGFTLFGICFALFFMIYTIKSFLLSFLDFLFLTSGGFVSYNFTIFLYNKVYGLLLIPIVALLPFVSPSMAQIIIAIGAGLFVLFYFFRILRGIQIAFKNRLSIFYLFLYLCALEILPLLVLYKLIIMYK